MPDKVQLHIAIQIFFYYFYFREKHYTLKSVTSNWIVCQQN